MNNTSTQIFSNPKSILVPALLTGLLTLSGVVSAQTDQSSIENPEAANEEVNYTLQQKIEDKDGELLATQPGKVAVEEEANIEKASQNNRDQTNSRAATVNQVQVTPAIVSEPKLAGEAGGNIEATPITLQQKVKDKRGELEATQPGQVEVQESRSIRTQ